MPHFVSLADLDPWAKFPYDPQDHPLKTSELEGTLEIIQSGLLSRRPHGGFELPSSNCQAASNTHAPTQSLSKGWWLPVSMCVSVCGGGWVYACVGRRQGGPERMWFPWQPPRREAGCAAEGSRRIRCGTKTLLCNLFAFSLLRTRSESEPQKKGGDPKIK